MLQVDETIFSDVTVRVTGAAIAAAEGGLLTPVDPLGRLLEVLASVEVGDAEAPSSEIFPITST